MMKATRLILNLILAGTLAGSAIGSVAAGITGCAARPASESASESAAGPAAAHPTKIRPATLSKHPGPFPELRFGFFKQGGPTYDPAYVQWKRKYKLLTRKERIRYCIDELQNERQSPGGFPPSLLPEGTYAAHPKDGSADDPLSCPRAELIKFGKDAIPSLIAALDRKEKTKIITWRWFREPWLVQDAALFVIQRIACREFSRAIHRGYGNPDAEHKSYLAALSKEEHNKLRATIQLWWEENKATDTTDWAENALITENGYGGWAARYLYARTGAGSSAILIRAYNRLPKGTDTYDIWDGVRSQKQNILRILAKNPSPQQKPFLLRVLNDRPFVVRLDAAGMLWALKDKTGLERILTETQEKIIPAWGDGWMQYNSYALIFFFSSCGTPEAKEMIVKCLDATNPYLRRSAVEEIPKLKMEQAARKLPSLFGDPFIINGSEEPYHEVCDAAAEAFNKVVPQSPRFGGSTDEEQNKSIRIIDKWWQANQQTLLWNKKLGILEPKKSP